ncbi:MAG: septum formation initiator family protein [Candidatus Kapaibacterium sp.]|nr:septum formation initiator family protein [Ignavibacteriota bacterium]MCB9222088.1 septum formation initiator family protein [Ignavibacteria bacterium]
MSEDSKQKIYENPVKRHLVVGGVILFIILIFYLFTDYGAINKISYINKESELTEKTEKLVAEIDSLKKLEIQMKNDTLEIERLAREKYGMIKQGEKVIFINKKKVDEESGD